MHSTYLIRELGVKSKLYKIVVSNLKKDESSLPDSPLLVVYNLCISRILTVDILIFIADICIEAHLGLVGY